MYKYVLGFNNYIVNDDGVIESLNYRNTNIKHELSVYKQQNHCYVKLNDGISHAVHVITWEAFNSKKVPDGYVIHHINFNPEDNRIENLQCITIEEHVKLHKSKIIQQFDKHYTHVINEFSSLTEAGKALGLNSPGNIGSVCTGKLKTAYGYGWKYKDNQ